MSIFDNGGFDLMLEVSPTFASQLFALGPAIAAPDAPFTTPAVSGTARIRLTRNSAAFAPGNGVTLSLNLAGSTIEVTSAPGFPTIPAGLRTVDLSGAVAISDTVDAAGLNVAIDTTPDAAQGKPSVDVTLDNAAVLASPLVSILLAQAYILGGQGGMDAARNALLDTIRTALGNGIRAQLATTPLQQTVLSIPARFLPPGVPNNPPATVPPVAVRTTGSMLVGVQLGSVRGGNLSRVRSPLRRSISGGFIDGLAMVLSNACLLRDFVRPTLGNRFGLSPGGFLAGDPFLWFGSSTVPLPGTPPITITSAGVSVDEMQDLVLRFSFTSSALGGGVSVTASVAVPATLAVSAAGGSITVTFTPGRARVTSSRVDVAWWVYLLSAVTLGVAGVAALALADAIADGAIAGPLETLITGALSAITVTVPLPAGLPPLAVTMQSLFQTDAPQRMVPSLGGVILPASGRDHDLIVTFAA
jgi:hypothetical protein